MANDLLAGIQTGAQLASVRMANELKKQQLLQSEASIKNAKKSADAKAMESFLKSSNNIVNSPEGMRRGQVKLLRQQFEGVMDVSDDFFLMLEDKGSSAEVQKVLSMALNIKDPQKRIEFLSQARTRFKGFEASQIGDLRSSLEANAKFEQQKELVDVTQEATGERQIKVEREKQKLLGERELKVKNLEIEQQKAKDIVTFRKAAATTAQTVAKEFGQNLNTVRTLINIGFKKDKDGNVLVDAKGVPIDNFKNLSAPQQFNMVSNFIKASTDPRITDGERAVFEAHKSLLDRFKAFTKKFTSPGKAPKVQPEFARELVQATIQLADSQVKEVRDRLTPTVENLRAKEQTPIGILTPFQRQIFENEALEPGQRRTTFDLFLSGFPTARAKTKGKKTIAAPQAPRPRKALPVDLLRQEGFE